MTDEEIKQAINDAVGTAFAGIQSEVEKLHDLQKPPEETPENTEQQPSLEPLQTRINNAIKSYVEDKREYTTGKSLEYKPNSALTGEGKEV